MVKKSLIPTAIVIFFLIVSSYFYRNKTLSVNFVDEDDNFTVGQYLLNGRHLYSNIFSHHQPLTYLLSSQIQKVFKPNSIYSLVTRHRDFIIIYSFLWCLLITWQFKWRGLFFTLIFEPLKIFIFGNLFLAESLSVYPLVYLIFAIIQTNTSAVFFGFCASIIFLSLLPLWPILSIFFIYLLLKSNQKIKTIAYVVLGALPLGVVVLSQFSISSYIWSTIYLNFKYYIPSFSQTSLTFGSSPYLLVVQLLLAMLALELIVLLRYKNIKLLLICIITLGLLNIRNTPIGSDYYRGFHLLPWLAALAALVSIRWPAKKIFYSIAVLFVITTLFVSRSTLWSYRNMEHDLYVNYSSQFDLGQAINIISSGNNDETLLAIPSNMLLYWQSKVAPLHGLTYYYPWMTQIQSLKIQVESSLPVYLYNPGSRDLSLYVQIMKNDSPTNLFVLKDKAHKITNDQIKLLKFYGFTI